MWPYPKNIRFRIKFKRATGFRPGDELEANEAQKTPLLQL